jgi:hypothetical protein
MIYTYWGMIGWTVFFTDTLERNNLLGNRNLSGSDQAVNGEQIPSYDVLDTKCVSYILTQSDRYLYYISLLHTYTIR